MDSRFLHQSINYTLSNSLALCSIYRIRPRDISQDIYVLSLILVRTNPIVLPLDFVVNSLPTDQKIPGLFPGSTVIFSSIVELFQICTDCCVLISSIFCPVLFSEKIGQGDPPIASVLLDLVHRNNKTMISR